MQPQPASRVSRLPLRQRRFYGDLCAMGQSRQSFLGAQFANTVIGIEGRHGQPTSQNHGNEPDKFSAHNKLLLGVSPLQAASCGLTRGYERTRAKVPWAERLEAPSWHYAPGFSWWNRW